ncbi:4Fe-4S binding protein [bacterium]|nr:MAG: 4Fe-4S binding protein [bacterium]
MEYKLFIRQRIRRQFLVSLIFILILGMGWRHPLLGFFIPLCMLLGIGIGLFRGRQWCSWYCPRGSFYDAIIQPLSLKKGTPPIFKNLLFRSAILVLLMLIMFMRIVYLWPNPHRIGLFFMTMLTATTVLGVILGVIFHQRSWCSFCPIGTVIHWLGGSRYPLKIDSATCTECGVCFKVCPMQIAPFKFKKDKVELVKDRDCLKCQSCVHACPEKSLSF